MRLPAEGQEFVRWDVSADLVLSGTLDIAFTTTDDVPSTGEWYSNAWDGVDVLVSTDAEGTELHTRSFRVLLAGSQILTPEVGAIQLSAGINTVWARFRDDPETIIRKIGRITAH